MKYYHKTHHTKRQTKLPVKLFGGILVTIGFLSVLYFFFPLLSYQLFLAPVFSQANIEVPVPKYLVVGKGGLGSLISQGFAAMTTDYTDARNWYPQLQGDVKKTQSIDSYILSIPKLKINTAVVSTVDYDLTQHLVQYFGTSVPPTNGTAVIFGHSTLPQWFDSKNYKTIFATLHTLKVGDEMYVNVQGVTYRYSIFSITVTTPDDVNMFSQSFDTSNITLVTCTPPGTIWKRLIIRASLDKVS